MKAIAYCLDWHLAQSDAFKDLLSEPLKGKIEIEFQGWDGENLVLPKDKSIPLLFCMLPPPEKIMKDSSRKLFWIPMWDQAQGYSDEWWAKLPKSLGIITFSDQPYKKATQSGLKTLTLRYFKNPKTVKRADWSQGRVLFYWNRVGMVGPKFITQLCNSLRIDTLLYKPDIDPRIEQNKYYELPEFINNRTKVKIIHTTKTRGEFLKKIESANIVLAPRLTEGVGMVFLEAMASGACVIAHNSPTMNEYIQNGSNGILLDNSYVSTRDKIRKLTGKETTSDSAPYLLSDNQPWQKLARLNLHKLGQKAHDDTLNGYQEWSASAAAYEKFLLG